eukprot:TRINITY_DN352789_c0_g1_i1.p1 TRINITY_DN352789_c0_g1~~TRINITY_DN352789_c0_g1_i1.p1  ORF type:complete len:663 (+),score=120.74 TRINITY_DN352789_c0_g1_i1:86-2074(+)
MRVIVFWSFFLCLLSSVLGRSFQYLSYAQMESEIGLMVKDYPDVISSFTAQEEYGFSSPGKCIGSNGKSENCKQTVVRLTQFESLKDDVTRPQVIFSGEIHGNERVGPTAVVELAKLLVENYGKKCPNKWLCTLLETRDIFIVPTANVIGYENNKREENGIDPNRDFPFDQNPKECFNSLAARLFNELWIRNIFQMGVTFHGGMQAIAYEWGDTKHKRNTVSPDDEAQKGIAEVMADYAGKFQGKKYPTGRLTDLVYACKGAMEDWAYASSWIPKSVAKCTPTKNGHYDQGNPNSAVFRTFNFLVETSDDKAPNKRYLGSTEELLKPSGKGDGHIPRNIRLGLIAIDMVQPYISWVEEPSLEIRPDVGTSGKIMRCLRTIGGVNLSGHVTSHISWEIGGALTVDNTNAIVGVWPKDKSAPDITSMIVNEDNIHNQEFLLSTQPLNGPTRWDPNLLRDMGEEPLVGMYKANVCLPIPENDFEDYFVVIQAEVDQNWGSQPNKPDPNSPAQSHVVNARLNKNWDYSNGNSKVKGQSLWFSKALRVRVHSTRKDDSNKDHIRTLIASNDSGSSSQDKAIHATASPSDCSYNDDPVGFPKSSLNFVTVLLSTIFIVAAVVFGVLVVKKRSLEGRKSLLPTKLPSSHLTHPNFENEEPELELTKLEK